MGKKKKKEGPGVQDQLKQYQTHPTSRPTFCRNGLLHRLLVKKRILWKLTELQRSLERVKKTLIENCILIMKNEFT